MTQDEIIEMARQAGFLVTHIGDPIGTNYAMIEAFANLVAAKKQERIIEVVERLGTWAHITEVVDEIRGEHAMREVQRLGQEIEQEPVADAYTFAEMRFVVCSNCGNKRCPKANDHRNDCTNSNEVGQKGSSWEHVKPLAQPEQEPVAECVDDGEGGIYYRTLKKHIGLLYTTPPQQEPVAWLSTDSIGERHLCFDKPLDNDPVQPLYTTPPQRTWVGLTESERRLINFQWQDGNGTAPEIIDLVEAKLKGKNT